MAYLPEVFTMEPLTRMQTDSPTGMERSSERNDLQIYDEP